MCQVVGSRPDVFSCELNFIKALVYTLCEDNLVPWLRYSFSDISLSVCLFVCVYDVGCFVDVLASRSGYCVRNLVFQ